MQKQKVPIFKGLPEIPKEKICINGGKTLEQEVFNKLNKPMNGKRPIPTPLDNYYINQLTEFYKNLSKALLAVPYKLFNIDDINNFKEYISYVYYYTIPWFPERFSINLTYRAVINKNITQNCDSLIKKEHLSYPPARIIKKYNRANSPNATMFYGCDTINTALNEIKPKAEDKVSVGVWIPKGRRNFKVHEIFHDGFGSGENTSTYRANEGFKDFKNKIHPSLVPFLEQYFSLLGREFSKPIDHNNEYLLSSVLSERILNVYNNPNYGSTEVIVFPSVGNRFYTNNLAIKKDVIDHCFILSKVIEFEVTETNYNFEIKGTDQNECHENIDLVKYTNYRETTNIKNNDIFW